LIRLSELKKEDTPMVKNKNVPKVN
jgi:hypothetical protein